MNLPADESVERQIIGALRDVGHIVLSIAESEPGMPDDGSWPWQRVTALFS